MNAVFTCFLLLQSTATISQLTPPPLNSNTSGSVLKVAEESIGKEPTAPVVSSDPIGSVLEDASPGPVTSTTQCLLCEQRGITFFGNVEYLLLKADRPGLDYALVDPTNDLSPQGQISSANWDTRSGIRSTIGFINSDHTWFSNLTYTYFHTAGNSQVTSPNGGTIYGLSTAPSVFGGEFNSAAAGSNLNYNVLDKNIGRLFSLGKKAEGRVFGGLRGAWIDQEMNAYYTNAFGTTLVSNPISFHGIGLHGGGRADWWFTDWLGIFGSADMAMMVGDISTSLHQTSDGGQTYQVAISSKDRDVIPVFGLATGAQFNWRSIQFTVGYEVTQWINLIQTYDVVGFVGNPAKLAQKAGDLSLSGLFLQLGLKY